MFAYCRNNPIFSVDGDGERQMNVATAMTDGGFTVRFKTIQEAARHQARCHAKRSKKKQVIYAAVIVSNVDPNWETAETIDTSGGYSIKYTIEETGYANCMSGLCEENGYLNVHASNARALVFVDASESFGGSIRKSYLRGQCYDEIWIADASYLESGVTIELYSGRIQKGGTEKCHSRESE